MHAYVPWIPLLILTRELSQSARARLESIWKVADYWTPEQRIACCLLYVIYILLSWGTHLASAWGHLPLPDLQQRFEIGFLASQHSSDNVGAVVHCHSDSAAENSFILLA